MYAVINHLHLTIPLDNLREPLAQEGVPLLASLPGFRRFSLIKESENRGIALILWDTEANAINGGREFGPTWFAQHVAPYLASDQERTLGEIIVDHQV